MAHTLHQDVYKRLKQDILTCKLSPGERLSESKIADEMHTSRTPVREALRLLERAGFLQSIQGRGFIVTDISLDDMIHIFQVRENLEAMAASLAAPHFNTSLRDKLKDIILSYDTAISCNDKDNSILYDEMFHREIVMATGNPFLLEIVDTISDKSRRCRYLYHNMFSQYESMPYEHEVILDSLSSKAPHIAKITARDHVSRMKQFIINEKLAANLSKYKKVKIKGSNI